MLPRYALLKSKKQVLPIGEKTMPDSTPHLLQQVRFFNLDSPLLKYQNNIESQNGEDGIIAHIFSVLPPAEKRYCVEFGAWDGAAGKICCGHLRECQPHQSPRC